jgi:ferredoxin
MKVTVDLDLCEAHGQCVMAAPEVFHIADGADLVTVLDDHPSDTLRQKVDEAASLCPVLAIQIED